ncbi:MAG: adenosylcobinamide amidohydrolase [Haloplanus sp.]
MFDITVSDGVTRIGRSNTRWLSTGHDGGIATGPAAYNCTVPDDWDRTDLDAYVAERLAAADFEPHGPTLLTGVDQRHARRAHLGAVEAVATAGLSNPAALPVDGVVNRPDAADTAGSPPTADATTDSVSDSDARNVGTVNVVVGTTRALAPGALANLLTVAAEAKAATLSVLAGVPGTTTDAMIAACDPAGDPTRFSGSATAVGTAARACVRDAVAASLAARYPDGDYGAAETGVVTDERAAVSALPTPDH